MGGEQGVPRFCRTVQAGGQARLEQAALHGGQLLAQQRHVAVPAVRTQCPPGAPHGRLGIRRGRPSSVHRPGSHAVRGPCGGALWGTPAGRA